MLIFIFCCFTVIICFFRCYGIILLFISYMVLEKRWTFHYYVPINHYAVFHQITKTKPFYKLLQNAEWTKHSITDCRDSNIQTKITGNPICCVLLNNIKPNPFINLFKMQIELNSLEMTAKSHISRHKTPISQYAVF